MTLAPPATTTRDRAYSDEQLDSLRQLHQAIFDSAEGFDAVADVATDERLATMFRGAASDRRQFAGGLRDTCFSDPGACVPSREASWVAAYRQVWIDILSMVSGGSTEALLREVVRG
ncbi:MAG: DUF2383 domain-containing protein, partial [Lacipirellulaceae bacterium]